MALNTFQGLMRSTGGQAKESGVTPGSLTMAVVISFDPTTTTAAAVRIGTSSSTGAFFTLPAGAVPLYVMSLGGGTGGTTPTVNIGSASVAATGTTAAFVTAIDADTKGVIAGADGTLTVGTGIPANTQVYGIRNTASGTPATGGTFTGVFVYTVYNNGVFDV